MRGLSNRRHWIIFIFIIITAFFSLTFFKMTNAEDNDVDLVLSEDGEKSPAIFNGSEPLLAPGININKNFDIQNKTGRSYCIRGIRISNFNLKDMDNNLVSDESKISYFCDNVKCKIEKIGWIDSRIFNDTIYEGNLSGLIATDGISIDDKSLSISDGGSKKFSIQIGMDSSADNRLQGLTGNLDIQIAAISKDDESNVVVIGGNNNTPASDSANTPVSDSSITPISDSGNTSAAEDGNTPTSNNNDTTTGVDSGKNNGEAKQTPVTPLSTGIVDGMSKLVQTGSFFDTTTLATIGSLLIGVGIFMAIRKRNK